MFNFGQTLDGYCTILIVALLRGEEHCLSHPSYLRLNCCLSRVGLLPVLRTASKRNASPAVCARQ